MVKYEKDVLNDYLRRLDKSMDFFVDDFLKKVLDKRNQVW